MGKMLIVKLPMPAAVLSPNARPKHWGQRSRAAKKARSDAAFAATAAIREQGISIPFVRAKVDPRWIFCVKRKRDDDNLTGWCKAYRDGMADAGVVRNDNDFIWMPPVQLVDPTARRPSVHFLITELEEPY